MQLQPDSTAIGGVNIHLQQMNGHRVWASDGTFVNHHKVSSAIQKLPPHNVGILDCLVSHNMNELAT